MFEIYYNDQHLKHTSNQTQFSYGLGQNEDGELGLFYRGDDGSSFEPWFYNGQSEAPTINVVSWDEESGSFTYSAGYINYLYSYDSGACDEFSGEPSSEPSSEPATEPAAE